MSSPILRRFTTKKGHGPGHDIRFLLTDLCMDGVRAVSDDLEQQARYGEIRNAPISVDFSDAKMEGEDIMLRLITVTAVLPAARGKAIAEDIRAAIISVFEQGNGQ